jgi:hypothetical protein
MTVAAQFFTLAGVALGALGSYLVGALGERTRHQRELAMGWEGRKFDSFVTYINDVKAMSVIARRMAVTLGLDDTAPDALDREEGARLLTDAETRRTVSMEMLRLLADVETISAAQRLNETVWWLEWVARGRKSNVTAEEWREATDRFMAAFDAFHGCARRELGVPGLPQARSPIVTPPLRDVSQ